MSDQPFQAPTPEYLAGLLPQYEIESFIAQGGMGAVYRGRQISLDRDVAIKILPREMGEDPEFRESFESEAKAMARLNHPNLLGVYDFGNAGGMPYIVMEYVHGKSLHDSAWNQAIEPSQAVAIVKGICDGLAHAHGNGIVHRDIKPSNILLTQMAEPKIGDFGLAHAADSDKPGLVMGTPGYTAPEVFRDPNQAGPLADIYAVGVILHQLLTGIDPAGNMEPPTQVTANPRLDAIWRKATQLNPALRYPSIAAMAADLDHRPAAQSASKAPGPAGAVPPRHAPSVHRGRPVQVKKSSGAPVKLVIICILAAATFFTYQQLQERSKNAGVIIVGGNETRPVEPPETAVEPPPTVRIDPKPEPSPKPVEIVTHEDPVAPPVVEPKPAEKPERALPLGDPDLQERAIGLIADSRKKRDKELADNVRFLRSDLAARARTADLEVASLIERLQKEISDNRIPIIDGIEKFGDRLAASLQQVGSKQESIEAGHRSDLTRIRDSYVTRLKGAATAASDPDLKQRLQAQADGAANMDAWITLITPESERPLKKFSAAGIVGKWTTTNTNGTNQWIAHPDGRMEVVGRPTWKLNWVILEDGSLEVIFTGKPKPYTFKRDGDGWIQKAPHGGPSKLSPGRW